MSGAQDTYQYDRQPGGDTAQWLGEDTQQGEEGEYQHGPHAARVGIHAQLVDEIGGQVSARYREHGDEIEHEDEQHAHGGVGGIAIDIGYVGGSPEEEEPPYAIRHELAHDERPCLAVGEAFQETYLRSLVIDGGLLQVVSVLVDVVQLRFVHVLVLCWLLVYHEPEAHPDVAQSADDHERHLPTEMAGQQGNGERGYQRAYGGAVVEDRRGESAIFLGEIFRGHLDGSGEVAGLTHGQYDAAEQEEPYADGGYRQAYMGGRVGVGRQVFLGALEAHQPVAGHDAARGYAAEGVQHGARAPDAYGPQVAFPCAHPVHHLSGEEHEYGVEYGEIGRDGTVVVVVPLKFRGYEVFPGE